ncbi:MAG: molybdenum cofactor guanylyltransferase [Cyclobacteriaceae bacterium]
MGQTSIKALVLIGGKSSRMGTDKYLLDIHGKPQYQHLYALLNSLGLETYISCSASQKASIPDVYRKVVDIIPDIGPIGGLHSAMSFDNKSAWLVVACDLINVNVETISLLKDEWDGHHDVLCFKRRQSEFYETTLAIYSPRCEGQIQSFIQEEKFGMQKLLKTCKVKFLTINDESVLKNANARCDLNPGKV